VSFSQAIIAAARVDVAEAKRNGTVGEKERERDTRCAAPNLA
jgi:hypothetical protein